MYSFLSVATLTCASFVAVDWAQSRAGIVPMLLVVFIILFLSILLAGVLKHQR